MSKKINILNNAIILIVTVGLLAMCPIIKEYTFQGDRIIIILLYVVGAIFAGFINAIVHELGHLIAGKINGFAFVSMTIWFFRWKKENSKINFSLCWIGEEAGYTEMVPKSDKNVKKGLTKMTEGGIIASFIMAILSILPVAFMDYLPIEAYAILSMFLPLSTYYYLGNALPTSSEGIKNDGATARMLRKNTNEAKVVTNILTIHSWLYNGKTPAEIDENLYFDLPQLPEDNVNFFMLLDARYAYYLDKGDIENALKVSERLESILEYAPKSYRYTVMVDMLYNVCVLKQDFDRADEIMYELDKYINRVNTAQNVRVKIAYLINVLEEKEDLKMFFDKAKREQKKLPLSGLAKYEEKLLQELEKSI